MDNDQAGLNPTQLKEEFCNLREGSIEAAKKIAVDGLQNSFGDPNTLRKSRDEIFKYEKTGNTEVYGLVA